MKRMVQGNGRTQMSLILNSFSSHCLGGFLLTSLFTIALACHAFVCFYFTLYCKQCIVVSTSCIWKVKLCSHKFLPVNKSKTFNVFRKNNRSIHLTQGGRSNNHMLRTGVPNGQIYQLNWLVTIQASSSFDKNKYTNQMKAVTTPCVTSD